MKISLTFFRHGSGEITPDRSGLPIRRTRTPDCISLSVIVVQIFGSSGGSPFWASCARYSKMASGV
jgi:hypothetical protein